MGEGQVTADGKRWRLPRPFLIIATQNLAESHGTFPLPNSQLDRFMVSMSIGLPTPEQEIEILYRSEHGIPKVQPVITAEQVVQMQERVMSVEVSEGVKQYLVNLAAASRDAEEIAVGVSPRGTAALVRACQAWSAFNGRDFVVPEDIQELAPNVWGHRVLVRNEAGATTGSDAVNRVLESVPVPI